MTPERSLGVFVSAVTTAILASACSGQAKPTTGTVTGPATTSESTTTTCSTSCLSFSAQLAQQNLDALVREHNATGALFGISIHGGPPIILASGVRDRTSNRPVEPGDAFYIASITKTFVGALVLSLVDSHEVRLDDPINRYGVDFGPAGNQITVRDLLAHTSGVPSPANDPGNLTPEQAIALARNQPLLFPPGRKTAYSNLDAQLAGQIVEQITGKPLVDVLHATLLDPLHLNATRYAAAEAVAPNTIPLPVPDAHAQAASMGAAGGMVSDIADLLAWGDAFLRTGTFLTPSTHALATTISAGGTGLGTIGFSDQDGPCVFIPQGCPPGEMFTAFGGSGSGPGISSVLLYNKNNDSVVAAFANIQNSPVDELARLAWFSQPMPS